MSSSTRHKDALVNSRNRQNGNNVTWQLQGIKFKNLAIPAILTKKGIA